MGRKIKRTDLAFVIFAVLVLQFLILPAFAGDCFGMPATDLTDGDDNYQGNENPNFIAALDGADILHLEGNTDRGCGYPGADTIYGGNTGDAISGGAGQDQVLGGEGADYDLEGGDAADGPVAGNDGDDSINGEGGDDIVKDGQGNDDVYGGQGNDDLARMCTDDQNDYIDNSVERTEWDANHC